MFAWIWPQATQCTSVLMFVIWVRFALAATLGDSDPKRMLGLDAGVVFEKDGTLSVLCTVTLLGYQIDAPWCWMSKSKEEQQLDELEISQEATGDLEALDKFDFQSGVTVTREFSETTFLHVQVRFWIWFIPCAIDLAVAGSTWGRLGIKTNLQGGFSVLGGVKPGATATLTLEVSIDIFIARLGVGKTNASACMHACIHACMYALMHTRV